VHLWVVSSAGLAELSEQVEEVVGDGLPQRVVIDGSQRASEVSGTGLAPAAVRSRGLSGALGISGTVRFASFPGTQLQVPLERVFARS